MSGIIALFVLGVWIACAYFLTSHISKFLVKKSWKNTWKKTPIFLGLFFVLLILPIVDDVIIGVEFRSLCKKNSTIQVDRDSVRGKAVYLDELESIKIEGFLMEATLKEFKYLDAKTDEVVVSFDSFTASGGILNNIFSSLLGPLTFKGRCQPGGVVRTVSLFKELGITDVDRRKLNLWRKNNGNK